MSTKNYWEKSQEIGESTLEHDACEFAYMHGWYQVKVVSPSHRGFPDRFFARIKGGIILVEFKRDGKEPTEQQLKHHRELRNHGVRVEVIDKIEQAYVIFG